MHITTMEDTIPPEIAEALWEVYDEGFRELNASSPCRQSFYRDEFLAALADPVVKKAVLRSEDGEFLAASIWCGDLDWFPWLSREYYEARYPDYYARGVIYYVVATLSLNKREGHMTEIMLDMTRRIHADNGIVVFDLCESLVDISWQEVIRSVSSQITPTKLEELGIQRYFAVTPE